MSEEMIENVARAMCTALNVGKPIIWEKLHREERQLYETAASAAIAAYNPNERLREALVLAYGLLWHMQIDREDDNLRLASDARQALLSVMSKDDQADGITRAKLTDARFTGAT